MMDFYYTVVHDVLFLSLREEVGDGILRPARVLEFNGCCRNWRTGQVGEREFC